ncbi:suppressor of fused domain protein [Ruminococcus flavefaciens]|uniref:Suppressor of fused-like domain-containing protein n=1 Tax=Ruminococcus flavefaciens 007c TaxID=1341157 RepID=W7UDJ1_RUMFL|nr:suppressor of fused domain protein [Ruminococcus flavefaciens]EWM53186.1 hypothetical protein RF007C_16375 [Ruminococcus flavefaciens 007c]
MGNIIFESHSPICNIDAVIEADENTYYLYLMTSPETGVNILRALWICNRRPAPDTFDPESMAGGKAPMMPKSNLAPLHPATGLDMYPEKISCCWFDSGNGVAIFYAGRLLCAIPPYAGLHDFPGFSLFAKGQTRYAWEMPADKNFEERCKGLATFWDKIQSDDSWPEIQEENLRVIEQFYGGEHEKYYAIDGGKFPLKALAQGRKNGVLYGITLGVSQFAMPRAEAVFGSHYVECNRIELGFAAQQNHEPLMQMMFSVMSDVARMPWTERDFLWHGHTFDFTNIRGFSAIVLINPAYIQGMECPQWRRFIGNRVNMLWLVPITAQELEYLRENGIAEMLKRCPDVTHLHIFEGRPKFSLH